MKHKDTPEDAQRYRARDLKAKTCECAECGARISMTDDNCFAFEVYLCPDCLGQMERIKPWTVLVSDLPAKEQEPFRMYIESSPRSIPSRLPGDPLGDKRAWVADYRRWRHDFCGSDDVLLAELPEEEQEPFMRHLIEWGHTLPWPWPGDPLGSIRAFRCDYERWKQGKPELG